MTDIIKSQKQYFNLNKNNINLRADMLKKLKVYIIENEDKILDALYKDLAKSGSEAYLSELQVAKHEIDYMLKNIKKFSKKHKVKGSISVFPSTSYIQNVPFGVCLILSPWNYPFSLAIIPLIAAIATGNCAILVPSYESFHTHTIINDMISSIFNKNFIHCISNPNYDEILKQKYDFIFYTGGSAIGKNIMKVAAENLTPVVLELGGKSPCIIDKNCDLTLTARRICFGKFLNAGQTCVAPDYILIHEDIHSQFLEILKSEIINMYSNQPINNKNYPKIINFHHLNRLKALISDEKLEFGGKFSETKLEPTILTDITFDDAIMQDEIFGPILPIIKYNDIKNIIPKLQNMPAPLALYLFSKDNSIQELIIDNISCGGVCINDTISHIINHNLPFGGFGNSGMGNYHGKYSFDTFSHKKSILKRSLLLDIPLRYAPYTDEKFRKIKKLK